MTFGIDIATTQAGIDLVRAKAEGTEFVIVKMGGLNVTPQYVAPYYRAQIDRVVAAGLPKGHYYLIGLGQTPEQQADFFVNNLHRFDPARDVLALDNERLDGNGTLWGDQLAARFVRRVLERLPGFPALRIWHYAGASDYRSLAPWPELERLGVRFWWAAYGASPTGRTPDHSPSLQGSISRWDVHQFTSRSRVAGYDVDGNYSLIPVGLLFGGSAPAGGGGSVAFFSARPAKGNMNQGFGPRPKPTPTSPTIHYGQDYGWGGGDAIYAARAGKVVAYAYVGAYGNRMIVDHGGGRRTWYCHLAAPVARVGQTVSAGQQIAWMGATGNVTAKHLHFELRIDGTAVDPEPYFAATSTSGGTQSPVEEKEIDMFIPYPSREDFRKDGFDLVPNEMRYLSIEKDPLGKDVPRDLAVVNDTAPLIMITGHVYATADNPGERLDICVVRQNAATGRLSPHYTERAVSDDEGKIMANPTFQMPKESGHRYFLRVHSPSRNQGEIRVERLAADAARHT
jgi:hypothetical protein